MLARIFSWNFGFHVKFIKQKNISDVFFEASTIINIWFPRQKRTI